VTRPHVSFLSYPFAAFVNPTLPLISVMVRRGYRVTCATTESFATRVAQLGAEPILCPRISLDGAIDEKDPQGGLDQFFRRYIEHVEFMIAESTRIYASDPPGLVLYNNLALAGVVLSRKLQIRAVQLNATFALDRSRLHRQFRDFAYRRDLIETSSRLDRFLEGRDIDFSDFLFSREEFNIYLFPKPLQPLAEVFGTDCFYAGRCAAEQPHYGDWNPGGCIDKRIVLISTSTMYVRGPEYFKMCIEALAGVSDLHVILSIGDSNDPKSLGTLPSNFEIIQHTAHLKLLPYVKLFIYLGGSISTSEAMYHGVPLLALSFGFKEIESMGERLEDLGIGIHLKKADMSAKSIQEITAQILSDSAMLSRVKEMSRIVRREPGAEETINRIEDHLAGC
jgi:MGT family glycosyltransferase